MKYFVAFALTLAFPAFAEEQPHHHNMHIMPERHYLTVSAADCTLEEVWDVGMGMCMPYPTAGMEMTHLMVRGNGFLAGITEQGPRGRSNIVFPNMVMADLGRTFGGSHYVNLDFMGTTEKWTLPDSGYPLLLQIGETHADGTPFVDAQHPHNTPIMGLTLSDTIRIGGGADKSHVKLFFAPRGEATEGPVPFMHRATGMTNPDAPLGHHIGQDVGHISSTVFGASLKSDSTRLEVSAFHGAEPQPTKVDLTLGKPDSLAIRLIEEFTPQVMMMISASYVANPEPDVVAENRYSASFYTRYALNDTWTWHNTAIFGLVSNYDHADRLASFGEEFLIESGAPRVWGRIEVLQRTPAELQIANTPDPNVGRWIAALTLGYTHRFFSWEGLEIAAGASVTKYLLPSVFTGAYDGNPWAAKVFLQAGGLKMWHL